MIVLKVGPSLGLIDRTKVFHPQHLYLLLNLEKQKHSGLFHQHFRPTFSLEKFNAFFEVDIWKTAHRYSRGQIRLSDIDVIEWRFLLRAGIFLLGIKSLVKLTRDDISTKIEILKRCRQIQSNHLRAATTSLQKTTFLGPRRSM